MKRPRTISAWWNGGRNASRTTTPIEPAAVPHRDMIRPDQSPGLAPEQPRDPVLDQARAVESFGDFQIQQGTDLLKENKPIETAADLQNVNAALELNPTLVRPEPEAPETVQPDPIQPAAMPMDPKPMPGG